jgi:AraC-like DNA-binding protein
MTYSFSIDKLPQIANTYTVTRKTVWQVADPYNILIFILDGECNISTAGNDYLLKEGDCMFIPAEQSYKRTPCGDDLCTMMYIHFSTDEPVTELENRDAVQLIHNLRNDIERALLDTKNIFTVSIKNIFLFPHTKGDGSLIPICKRIQELRLGYKVESSLFLSAYFCEILALLSKQTMKQLMSTDTDTDTIALPHTLKKAIWYIKQNHTKQISLDDLCRFCNISQAQLTRYFKKAFNTTPTQYITEFKIGRAREMLQNSPELSIKNVCGMLGFDDQHYFSRVFLKVCGETATEYRKRLRSFNHAKNDK